MYDTGSKTAKKGGRSGKKFVANPFPMNENGHHIILLTKQNKIMKRGLNSKEFQMGGKSYKIGNLSKDRVD